MQDMIFCIAELESGKQPLATQYDKKTKETSLGIMLISPNTAQWLMRYTSTFYYLKTYIINIA